MGKIVAKLAAMKLLESWTWAKCEVCLYLIAVAVSGAVLFVLVPLAFYK